jgi:cytochrome c
LRGRATADPDLKKDVPMKDGVLIAVLVLTGVTANPTYGQDAEHGKTIFKACAACHATDHANRVGPGLEGIIGRKAGTAPGFSYSSAMKQSGIVWDAKTLDAYLESPQKAVPGNRMTYTGLKNPTDRTDLVTYLATLK